MSRRGRQNAQIVAAFLILFLAAVVAPYLLMVQWIPSWFPSPRQDLPFDLALFTYVDQDEGTAGEPDNLLLIADGEQQIIDEFREAGLIQVGSVDEQPIETTIEEALLERVTPISERYLFGRKHDHAFQSPSDSVAHRHHLRV